MDVIQSSSLQPVKDRVPVVRYPATHSSDRWRFFPCQWCRRETVAGRPKPRRDDGWWSMDDSARQQDRRQVLLLVAKDKISSSFAVHWRYRHRCHNRALLQNWLLQYRAGLPHSTIDHLQSVLHAAVCIITAWWCGQRHQTVSFACESIITSHLPWETSFNGCRWRNV